MFNEKKLVEIILKKYSICKKNCSFSRDKLKQFEIFQIFSHKKHKAYTPKFL